jgi:hypothetical protein
MPMGWTFSGYLRSKRDIIKDKKIPAIQQGFFIGALKLFF